MIRQEIKKILKQATAKEAKIDYPPAAAFGDYSTNVAIKERLDPQKIVAKIKDNPLFEKVEVKGGFINFFIAKEYLQSQVEEILKQGKRFGCPTAAPPQAERRVQVEFISANPTGPLTLGNGRGGFCGDVLANILAKAGYKVEREYYINDRGEQIKKLGHSVIGDGEAVYKGDYIDYIRNELRKELNSFQGRSLTPSFPEKVGEKAAKIILEEMIKPTVKRMGIKYDKWFSEKSLYTSKAVDKVLVGLKKKNLAYEKGGALWFKSTHFGDDKDRVLVKADREYTYFASDVAYTKNKFKRGFDKLIYFWGADHYGYVKRMQAVVQALGFRKEQAEFIVMQLVRLFRAGKQIRMSKRKGVYVTLDELFDELCSVNPLGMDVARFFFLTRSPNTHLNFDLDLAKEQSEKNPVYYVQYAHARICSILAKLKTPAFARAWAGKQNSKLKTTIQNLKLLTHPSELTLIKQLIRLPEVVEDTANDYQVQRLPKYAQDLATAFHQFYTNCRVIDEANKNLTQARLALAQATKIVLKNTLALMGITAPSKM